MVWEKILLFFFVFKKRIVNYGYSGPKKHGFSSYSAFSDELWPKINMTEKLHVFISQGRFDIHHSGLQWHCCAFKWPISSKLTEFWKIRVENPTSKVRLFGQKYPFSDHCAIRHGIYWISSTFSKRDFKIPPRGVGFSKKIEFCGCFSTHKYHKFHRGSWDFWRSRGNYRQFSSYLFNSLYIFFKPT